MFFIFIIYTLIVFVSTNEGSRQNEYETSFRPLEQLGSKYYYFGTFYKANYFEASQYCNFHRMRLATIETSEENDLLLNHIQKSYSDVDNFWTSGTDLTEEGHFVWLSTGERFLFTSWEGGQPDNSLNVENCVEIRKYNNQYNWNDRPCDAKFHFICELLD